MTDPRTTSARATAIDAPSGSDGARIGTLDILRGVALFGMILIHFSLRVTEKGGGELFSNSYWKVMLLFEQRFWVLFAILFGAGFAVHLRRAQARGTSFIPIYLRRLAALAVFGLIAEGLFGYNVLLGYAIWGVALLLVRNWSVRALTILLLMSLASTTLQAIVRASYRVPVIGEAAYIEERLAVAAEFRQRRQALEEAEKSPNYATVVAERFRFMPARYGHFSFFMPATNFAFFLMGLIALRLGLFERPREHWKLIVGLMALGFVSFPLAWWMPRSTLAELGSPLLPALIVHFARRFFGLIRVEWLAFVYAGIVLLLVARNQAWLRRLSFFGWPGRMALTAYIGHIALIDLLFSTYALDLKINPLHALIGALLLITGLVPASRWWLSRFRFGPLEWLWRSVTHGSPQPMRMRTGTAATPAVAISPR